MNKKNFKVLLAIAVAIISLFGIARIYLNLNAGFYPTAIKSQFLYRENWQQPIQDNLIEAKVSELLNQKFTFLGKGAQIFAFESEDDQYVLKIVNQKHISLMQWEKLGLLLPYFSEILQKKLERQEEKVKKLLTSVKLSFEELQSETGLIYLHLQKTDHLKKTIHIQDKIGINHDLDADQLEFFIQKKGATLTQSIEKLMSIGKTEEASLVLHETLLFLVNCALKGVDDGDKQQYAMMRNVGFTSEGPIYIDTGLLTKDEKIANANNYKNDIIRRSRGLFNWLHKNYPLLYVIYINQIENI